MVSLEQLCTQFAAADLAQEYTVQANLNLYDAPTLQALATQAAVGRHLHLRSRPQVEAAAVQVCLCEDGYPGWLPLADLVWLQVAPTPYVPPSLTPSEIQARLPGAIAFCLAAMKQPNVYLWGGTVGPNYDCSGLIQHAFAAQGIWLPRDAYQQEAFLQPLPYTSGHPEDLLILLRPGDLIFFGPPEKATHVALYLGEGRYIHSSGTTQGRNGIGIDSLLPNGNLVSRSYYAQVRGAGRVVASYQPQPRD